MSLTKTCNWIGNLAGVGALILCGTSLASAQVEPNGYYYLASRALGFEQVLTVQVNGPNDYSLRMAPRHRDRDADRRFEQNWAEPR